MQLTTAPAVAFSVAVAHEPPTVVVTGDLDARTAPRLRESLVELARGGDTQVTLDLRGLKFIDSCGLGVILGGHKQLVLGGGRGLVVVAPSRPIRKVLELTGLSHLIEVKPPDAD